MSKFHINPKTGNPNVCRAQYHCPFGDHIEDHFESKEEARDFYEAKMSGDTLALARRNAKLTLDAQEKADSILTEGWGVTPEDRENLAQLKSAGAKWRINIIDQIEVSLPAYEEPVAVISRETAEQGDDLAEALQDEETGHYGSVIFSDDFYAWKESNSFTVGEIRSHSLEDGRTVETETMRREDAPVGSTIYDEETKNFFKIARDRGKKVMIPIPRRGYTIPTEGKFGDFKALVVTRVVESK